MSPNFAIRTGGRWDSTPAAGGGRREETASLVGRARHQRLTRCSHVRGGKSIQNRVALKTVLSRQRRRIVDRINRIDRIRSQMSWVSNPVHLVDPVKTPFSFHSVTNSHSLTLQLPVEERRAATDAQADLAGQSGVAGEDEEPPAGKVFAHRLTDGRVEAKPLLLLADALAVGRVADHHAGRGTFRRPAGADVAAQELDGMADPRALGVGSGQFERAGVDVAADDRRGKFLANRMAGVVADGVPERPVEVDPALEGEPLPRQTRRPVEGDPGSLDRRTSPSRTADRPAAWPGPSRSGGAGRPPAPRSAARSSGSAGSRACAANRHELSRLSTAWFLWMCRLRPTIGRLDIDARPPAESVPRTDRRWRP